MTVLRLYEDLVCLNLYRQILSLLIMHKISQGVDHHASPNAGTIIRLKNRVECDPPPNDHYPAYLHRLNNPWRHTEDVIWRGLSIECRSSESSHKSDQPTHVNTLY
ncbi:hypothetical protein I7I48_02348 [Histoplasma ohiense]|nr:hypothetical protein I7I48_02348 [Histoplasma ohiense (nom. inval.)]